MSGLHAESKYLKRKLEFYNREYESSVKKLKALESLLGDEDKVALSVKIEQEPRPSSPCHDSDGECEFQFPEVVFRDVPPDEIEKWCQQPIQCEESGTSSEQELLVLCVLPGPSEESPHSRSECRHHAFSVQPTWKEPEGPFADNAKYCSFCMCFICEDLASKCFHWSASQNAHCNAHRRSRHWKDIRTAVKSDLVRRLPATLKTDDYRSAITTMQTSLESLQTNFTDFRKGEESFDDDYYDDSCYCYCHDGWGNEYCDDCTDYHDRHRRIVHRFSGILEEVRRVCRELECNFREATDITTIILKLATFTIAFFRENYKVSRTDYEYDDDMYGDDDYDYHSHIKLAVFQLANTWLNLMTLPLKTINSDAQKWAAHEVCEAVNEFKKNVSSIRGHGIRGKLSCIKASLSLGSGMKNLLKHPTTSKKAIHHPVFVAAAVLQVFLETKRYALALRYIALGKCTDSPDASGGPDQTSQEMLLINTRENRDQLPFLLTKDDKPFRALHFTALPYDHKLKDGRLLLVDSWSGFMKVFSAIDTSKRDQVIQNRPLTVWPALKCKAFIDELMGKAGYQEGCYSNGGIRTIPTILGSSFVRCSITFLLQILYHNKEFMTYYSTNVHRWLYSWLSPKSDSDISLEDVIIGTSVDPAKGLHKTIAECIDNAKKRTGNYLKPQTVMEITQEHMKAFMANLLVQLLSRRVCEGYPVTLEDFTKNKLYKLAVLLYLTLEQKRNSVTAERFSRIMSTLTGEMIENVLPHLKKLPYTVADYEKWLQDPSLSIERKVKLICTINHKLDKGKVKECQEMQLYLMKWAKKLLKQIASGRNSTISEQNVNSAIKKEFLPIAEKLNYIGLKTAILKQEFMNTMSWNSYQQLAKHLGTEKWTKKEPKYMDQIIQKIKRNTILTFEMALSLELLINTGNLDCIECIFRVAARDGFLHGSHREVANLLFHKAIELLENVTYQDHLDRLVKELQPLVSYILFQYGLVEQRHRFRYIYNKKSTVSLTGSLYMPASIGSNPQVNVMSCLKKLVGEVAPSVCGTMLKGAMVLAEQEYNSNTVTQELRTYMRDWLMEMRGIYMMLHCEDQFAVDFAHLKKVLKRKKPLIVALEPVMNGQIPQANKQPPALKKRPLSQGAAKLAKENSKPQSAAKLSTETSKPQPAAKLAVSSKLQSASSCSCKRKGKQTMYHSRFCVNYVSIGSSVTAVTTSGSSEPVVASARPTLVAPTVASSTASSRQILTVRTDNGLVVEEESNLAVSQAVALC